MRLFTQRSVAVGLCGALVLAVGGWFFLVFGLAVRTQVRSTAPNDAYVADVTSTYRSDFWGGPPHDTHEVRIFAASGRLLNRLSLDDRTNGWPGTCVIEWPTDSGVGVCVLKRENRECARVTLPLDEL